MNGKYRSRKFLVALGIELVSTVLLLAGYLDGAQWVTLSLGVLALYGAADVGDKYVSRSSITSRFL